MIRLSRSLTSSPVRPEVRGAAGGHGAALGRGGRGRAARPRATPAAAVLVADRRSSDALLERPQERIDEGDQGLGLLLAAWRPARPGLPVVGPNLTRMFMPTQA